MGYDYKFGQEPEQLTICDTHIAIEGIGKDAEIVTNKYGGKQSKSPMAMHLVDATFLANMFSEDYIIEHIVSFMKTQVETFLRIAVKDISKLLVTETRNDKVDSIIIIAKVLQEGADKYEPNNWRLIPQEEHINHALIHYIAYLKGDKQDDHLEHCMCRLMMAYATKVSEGFNYCEFTRK